MVEAMKRRRGRPPRLSRDTILEVADSIPLGEISMLRIAKTLRTSDAALYYYFPTRDALMRTLADRYSRDIHPCADLYDWRAWMRDYARQIRAVLKRHPGAADFMVIGGPTGPHQLSLVETALSVMTADGLPLDRAWLIYASVVNHVLRCAQAADRAAVQQDKLPRPPAERLAREIEEGDAAKLPLLTEIFTRNLRPSEDDIFEFGLEALLAYGASNKLSAVRKSRNKI